MFQIMQTESQVATLKPGDSFKGYTVIRIEPCTKAGFRKVVLR